MDSRSLITLALDILLVFAAGWFFLKTIKHLEKSKENPSNTKRHILEGMPQVFTTLGILGTFAGISIGLWQFDSNNISASIPALLDGLKTAFIASMIGVFLNIIFSKVIEARLDELDKDKSVVSNEMEALQAILEEMKENKSYTKSLIEDLKDSIMGDSDNSIKTQFVNLGNKVIDQNNILSSQDTRLTDILKSLRQEGVGLFTVVQNLREDMKTNKDEMSGKFDEFVRILSDSNTKVLVDAIEKVIKDFNEKMQQLVGKLVQENFDELNRTVGNMNQWQKENKEHIQSLTNQFKSVSDNLSITSTTLESISKNTHSLTEDNSHLKKIVEELQNVMVQDRKFSDLIFKLNESGNAMQSVMNAEAILRRNLDTLLLKFDQISSLKDVNHEFWQDIKSKMLDISEEIAKTNNSLNKNIETLDQSFERRLSTSFQNLDKSVMVMVEELSKRFKDVMSGTRTLNN